MPNNHNSSFDFIALGETLIDFISAEEVNSLMDAATYKRFVGGEPTNLSRNMALLGNQAALAACVGEDHFGKYIRDQLDQAGVNTNHLQTTLEAPTTFVPVTRTQGGTPDFMIYRGADAFLRESPGLMNSVANSHIVHTSAFAISREPARSTILEALKIVQPRKTWVTFDPNYHPAIWPDTPNMPSLLERAFEYIDITKPSLDDCARIFSPGLDPSEYAQRFIQWGAKIVMLTMGSEGILMLTAQGEEYRIYANPIHVQDVTGAGDAFWAGFLSALLAGESPLSAARQGQALAETKIGTVGPLAHFPNRERLSGKGEAIRYEKMA